MTRRRPAGPRPGRPGRRRPAGRGAEDEGMLGTWWFAAGEGGAWNASGALSPSRVAADRLDRARHDRVDAELAQRRAGAARVAAVDAVRRAGFRCVAQALQP